MISLDIFEQKAKPKRMAAITTHTIDHFKSERAKDRGRKPGSRVSPATINKDLRHIKAALRYAVDWGYMTRGPKFRMVREAEEIGPVVTEEHFRDLYDECKSAALPKGQPYTAAEWWQALLVFALTTGWRISEILSLRREDLDLESGAVKTRAGDNKGGRDDCDYLQPASLQHVTKLRHFEAKVFHWPYGRRLLYEVFHAIQREAGIHLACPRSGEHQCTDACHVYGFHALRRAYATFNAELPATVLQKKMRHRSFTTTQRYIKLADKMKKAAEVIYVPAFLEVKRG